MHSFGNAKRSNLGRSAWPRAAAFPGGGAPVRAAFGQDHATFDLLPPATATQQAGAGAGADADAPGWSNSFVAGWFDGHGADGHHFSAVCGEFLRHRLKERSWARSCGGA